MKSLLQTIQLLFFPTAFREGEVEHIRSLIAKGRVMSDPDAFRPEAEKRIAKKRKGLLISFVVVAVLVLSGFAGATVVNYICPLSMTTIRWLRVASVIVIAWAVLGRIGYETETYSQETLLEVASVKAFKQFYGLGVFLAAFALFLEGPRV
jgi:hypothetical protein